MDIKEIVEFIKLIPSVVKIIKKGREYNYNMYIQKVYNETRDIVNNYFKILNDTKTFLGRSSENFRRNNNILRKQKS